MNDTSFLRLPPATAFPSHSPPTYSARQTGKSVRIVSRKIVEGTWRSAGCVLNSRCFSSLAAQVVLVVFDQTVSLPNWESDFDERFPHLLGRNVNEVNPVAESSGKLFGHVCVR